MNTMQAMLILIQNIWNSGRWYARWTVIFFAVYPIILVVTGLFVSSLMTKAVVGFSLIPAIILVVATYPIATALATTIAGGRRALRLISSVLFVEATMGVYIALVPTANNPAAFLVLSLAVSAIGLWSLGLAQGDVATRTAKYLFWVALAITASFFLPNVFESAVGENGLVERADKVGGKIVSGETTDLPLPTAFLGFGILAILLSFWEKMPCRSIFGGIGGLALLLGLILSIFPETGKAGSIPNPFSSWTFVRMEMTESGRLTERTNESSAENLVITGEKISFDYETNVGAVGTVELVSTDGVNYSGFLSRPGDENIPMSLTRRSGENFMGKSKHGQGFQLVKK